MADEITSTDRRNTYKVRFSPNGETYYVKAANAVSAHQKGMGLAALDDVYHNGCDVTRASDAELAELEQIKEAVAEIKDGEEE